jgi:hypothetical protein
MVTQNIFDGCYDGCRKRLPTLRTFGAVVLVIVAVLAVFFIGDYAERVVVRIRANREPDAFDRSAEFYVFRPARSIIHNTLADVPIPGSREKLAGCGLPVHDLRIAPQQLRKLQATARRVTTKGYSVGIPREYVPAKFRIDGRFVPIKVKLRGFTDWHYSTRRPSLRLKFPDNHLFDGKKQINLSEPYDKGLTIDLTTNWELQRHGILTWDSRFVVLRLNGNVVGLFQEIEQFGRSMTDRNGRSEGYIFSGRGQLFGKEGPGFDQALAAIERVKRRLEPKDEPDAAVCDWAFFREYFDADRWAWAGAMTAVLASCHAWDGDNLRLYWDPSRGKFEPIPWDYHCFTLDPHAHPEGEVAPAGGYRNFNHVPEYRRMRDRRTWKLLTERIDAMVEHSETLFDELRDILPLDTSSTVHLRAMSLRRGEAVQAGFVRTLRHNKQYLTTLFNKHDLRAVAWTEASGRVTLELENHGKSFLAVRQVIVEDGVEDGKRRHAHPLPEPVIVDGPWQGEPGRCRCRVAIPTGTKPVGLTVWDEVIGAAVTASEITMVPGEGQPPPIAGQPEKTPLRLAIDNVRTEPRRVVFGPGRVLVERTHEIPASHDVVFAPGLELKMGKGASLLIHGNLTSVGGDDAAITISGADPREPWGGILVQGTRLAPSHVRMEHTVVEGGTGGRTNRIRFTSSLSVHDGVVSLRSCEFNRSEADDGINLKHCEVDLRANRFRGSKDDAVDLDFCTGAVVGNEVVGAGGDGLDFSGSRVRIERNHIRHCADKGISLGERTDATVADNRIAQCKTGIAVKDRSCAEIRNDRLSDLQVGIALYVKKPTFGPSRATLKDVVMHDVATRLLRDGTCTVEGE